MIQICSGSVWIIKVSYHRHWKWKVVAGLPEWSANQYFWGQLSREDCYHYRTNGHHLQGFCYDRLQIWRGMISLYINVCTHFVFQFTFCSCGSSRHSASTVFLQAWISHFEIKICLQTQSQCLYLDKTKPDSYTYIYTVHLQREPVSLNSMRWIFSYLSADVVFDVSPLASAV